MRVVFEGLRFGHEGERLWIIGSQSARVRSPCNWPNWMVTMSCLMLRLDPVGDAVDVGLGPVDVLAGEELLEIGDHRVVDLEVLVDGVIGEVDAAAKWKNTSL